MGRKYKNKIMEKYCMDCEYLQLITVMKSYPYTFCKLIHMSFCGDEPLDFFKGCMRINAENNKR